MMSRKSLGRGLLLDPWSLHLVPSNSVIGASGLSALNQDCDSLVGYRLGMVILNDIFGLPMELLRGGQ